jgi:hypothetical protein
MFSRSGRSGWSGLPGPVGPGRSAASETEAEARRRRFGRLPEARSAGPRLRAPPPALRVGGPIRAVLAPPYGPGRSDSPPCRTVCKQPDCPPVSPLEQVLVKMALAVTVRRAQAPSGGIWRVRAAPRSRRRPPPPLQPPPRLIPGCAYVHVCACHGPDCFDLIACHAMLHF